MLSGCVSHLFAGGHELTVAILRQVELSALCVAGEDTGQHVSPFEDFDGDELDYVRAALLLQKVWSATPVEEPIRAEEVPIATLAMSRSSSPTGVASSGDGEKAAGCEAGGEENIDAFELMKTRSSGKKRARVEVRVRP